MSRVCSRGGVRGVAFRCCGCVSDSAAVADRGLEMRDAATASLEKSPAPQESSRFDPSATCRRTRGASIA